MFPRLTIAVAIAIMVVVWPHVITTTVVEGKLLVEVEATEENTSCSSSSKEQVVDGTSGSSDDGSCINNNVVGRIEEGITNSDDTNSDTAENDAEEKEEKEEENDEIDNNNSIDNTDDDDDTVVSTEKKKDDVDGDDNDPNCFNNVDEPCDFWAHQNPSECDVNPDYMLMNCRLACRMCNRHKSYSDIAPTVDGQDLGVAQDIGGDKELDITTEDIINRIVEAQEYMSKLIKYEKMDPELLRSCKNDNELCTYWSLTDDGNECENNPGYMKTKCGPACMSCEMLSIETRCPMDRETIGPDVWPSAGDLDSMFRRITSEPYLSQYNVRILSSPTFYAGDADIEGDGDDVDGGPWVITMDNFVTEQEAARLIEMGAVEGYERSTDVGSLNVDGSIQDKVSTGRTSTNAWCSNECINDDLVQQVTYRISNMTQFPVVNSEDLQLLRYGPGQRYTVHHDYIEHEIDRQEGVRAITVYLYLNDVEAGGGTNFPKLDITVMPKRGRVLIWPSVLNDDPNHADVRTDHQALPVEAGIKYGANAWLHMRDFKSAHERGCS